MSRLSFKDWPLSKGWFEVVLNEGDFDDHWIVGNIGVFLIQPFFDEHSNSHLDTEHFGFQIYSASDADHDCHYVSSAWIHGVRVPGIFEVAKMVYELLEKENTWDEMLEMLKRHFATEPPQYVKGQFVSFEEIFESYKP
jgi:hypothetical protein